MSVARYVFVAAAGFAAGFALGVVAALAGDVEERMHDAVILNERTTR